MEQNKILQKLIYYSCSIVLEIWGIHFSFFILSDCVWLSGGHKCIYKQYHSRFTWEWCNIGKFNLILVQILY